MHFCADEAMMLVALLGGAWHYWTCGCSNIDRTLKRLICRIFGHPSLRKMGPVYHFDGGQGINRPYCRRCNREMFV